MKSPPKKLGTSTEEQTALRHAARWAADCASKALPIYEAHHPADVRPRHAIDGARAFADGKKRDKQLRTLAWDAHAASGKATFPPAKYAARAALLAASVAYTHTDLPSVQQARHLLGPVVYAALALEEADPDTPQIANKFLRDAARTAPPHVKRLLSHMPPQVAGKSRMSQLYGILDTLLRTAHRKMPKEIS